MCTRVEKKTLQKKKNEGPMGVVERYIWLLGEMTTIAMAIVANSLTSDHKSYV